IAKHRTEYDVDQRKPLAVEIAARSFALTKTGFKTREFLGQSLGLLRERRFIGSQVETGNIVENGRAEFDPGAMFGAAQRVARMQRKRLRFFQIFEDHRTFENCAVADLEHRRLAERRYRREPLRFVGEIDVNAFKWHLLFRQCNDGALHVWAENVTDERQLRHGHSPQT